MLTEVVAKGGNLLLNVGPKADGTIPDIQARILRDSGAWVNAHADAIHGSRPFEVWGDAATRYTVGADGSVFAIDLDQRIRADVPGPGRRRRGQRVPPNGQSATTASTSAPTAPIRASHGCTASRRRRSAVRAVIRTLDVVDGAVITEQIAGAQEGDVVTIPAGIHRVAGVKVPPGVTVRGESGATLDGHGDAVIELGGGSGSRAITVADGAAGYMMIPPTCVTTTGDGVEVRGCTLQSIQLGGGRGHRHRRQRDPRREPLGVRLPGRRGTREPPGRASAGGPASTSSAASGHVIEDNDIADDLCAVRLTGVTNSRVARQPRPHPVVGDPPPRQHVVREPRQPGQRTMRAQCVEGGFGNTVAENVAHRCDSSVLVEQGARDTEVRNNRAEDCRIDTLVWESS